MILFDWLRNKISPLRPKLRGTALTPYRFISFGINDYGGENDLNGCVNDAHDWSAFAKSTLGFAPDSCRTLLDRDATRDAVIAAWKWALEGIKPGQLVLLQGSCHGVQVPSVDDDEDDKLDEALCMYGFDWSAKTMITDDEIHDLFAGVPAGALVVFIADCCHSGTMHRSTSGPRPRRILPRAGEAVRGINAKKVRTLGACARSASSPNNLVVLSACLPHEFAYDATYRGRPNGAFTFTLLRTIAKYGLGDLTYRKLMSIVRSTIEYPQRPQLSCSPDLENLVAFKYGR